MLTNTRYAAHVDVIGDQTTHHGPFACGPADQSSTSGTTNPAGCC